MKNLKRLALVAIAAFALTTLTGYLYCPAVDPLDYTVILPDPEFCDTFFVCSNGVPIRQKCPEGLHFNAHLLVCDYPQNSGCNGIYGGGSGGGSTSGQSTITCHITYNANWRSPDPRAICGAKNGMEIPPCHWLNYESIPGTWIDKCY
ncbi:MAG: carbohydrate-binding module family 14 protein [Bacteroidales bacterium]|jgi:hypothetical protein|nr:carbohydrate-binding module family 14 protein [Bacteroidales bacterium]